MLTPTQINQIIDQHFQAIKENLRSLNRSTIRVQTFKTDNEPIGISKFGGLPHLPKEMTWPSFEGIPLAFIAQFRLSEIAPYDTANCLPNSGMLYFFYDASLIHLSHRDAPLYNGKILFLAEENQALFKRTAPKTLSPYYIFKTCLLKYSQMGSLPSYDSIAYPSMTAYRPAHLLQLSKHNLAKEYLHYFGKKHPPYFNYQESNHKLLGFSNPLQDSPLFNCLNYGAEKETFKNLFSSSNKYTSPAIRAELERWTLLFQVDTDKNTEFCWGDAGMLYFFIQKDELKKGKFDNIRVFLQC